MMVEFTFRDLVAFFSYEALLYAGGPLVAAALLLLLVPGLRRHAFWRWSAYAMIVLAFVLAACAVPMLQEIWREHEQHVAFEAATHHLSAPQVLGGITFPAGSTVHLGEDGRVEFGDVPTPTPIEGVALVGAFRLQPSYGDAKPDVAEGTLAQAIDISGIPCGPGELVSQTETTRCVLARGYPFGGHLLARGTRVEVYRSPLGEPPQLRFGTLGRPERLFDVDWPAGTILGGVDAVPSRPENGSEAPQVQFCIPSGTQVSVAGATLHGFIAYDVDGGRRRVSPVCNILPEETVGDDGYAQVGDARFEWGERADAKATWVWTDPLQADGKR